MMRRKGLTSIELAKLAGVSSATISRAFTADSPHQAAKRARASWRSPTSMASGPMPWRARSTTASRAWSRWWSTPSPIRPKARGSTSSSIACRQRERMPLLLCCADHEDRSQLMRIASTYQVDHVVLYSDMVSIDDAIDIFRSADARSSPRSSRSTAAPSPMCGSIGSGRGRDRRAPGRRRAGGTSPISPAAPRAISTSSAWPGSPRRSTRHGLAFELVEHGDYSYESGYKEAVLLLRRARPDVVVCANDLMAIGVKDAAALLGIACPRISPSSVMTAWRWRTGTATRSPPSCRHRARSAMR